jgi:hypothetical protein
MARYERDGRDLPVDAQGKVKLRRTPDGRLEIAPAPKRDLTAETEAQERPPQADDPRSSASRNVPPYGAA